MRKSDFYRRIEPMRDACRRADEARREIETIGFNQSSDANVLFQAFAKRFSVIDDGRDRQIPSRSDIRRLAKSGVGSYYELAFVLHGLLRMNGIDAECVYVYGDKEPEPHDNFTSDNVEHVLIYVPSLDQHFDPTSRLFKELRGAVETWLEGKNLEYRRGFPAIFSQGYFAKRSVPLK